MHIRVHRQPFLNPSARAVAERQARVRIARNDPVVKAMYSSKAWLVLRAQVLEEAGGRCCVAGCTRPARIVDHRRPHGGSTALFFDRGNLQAMCKPHHDAKTAKHDGGFGNVRR